MTDTRKLKDTMKEAAEEIRDLRRVNDILQAKMDMVEFFRTVLYTKPFSPSMGMREDPLSKLENAILDLIEEEREGKK